MLEDGDIICFQKPPQRQRSEVYRYPTVPKFLDYVHNRQVELSHPDAELRLLEVFYHKIYKIDDDERVTMIDFPQMVSVSHQNTKILKYFERDVECIFKFFKKRFNLNFDDDKVEYDDLEVVSVEGCRPQFSDIKKVFGFLDKELEASGFTKKNQDDREGLNVNALDKRFLAAELEQQFQANLN